MTTLFELHEAVNKLTALLEQMPPYNEIVDGIAQQTNLLQDQIAGLSERIATLEKKEPSTEFNRRLHNNLGSPSMWGDLRISETTMLMDFLVYLVGKPGPYGFPISFVNCPSSELVNKYVCRPVDMANLVAQFVEDYKP